jgi:hypothetical protein
MYRNYAVMMKEPFSASRVGYAETNMNNAFLRSSYDATGAQSNIYNRKLRFRLRKWRQKMEFRKFKLTFGGQKALAGVGTQTREL